MSTLESIDDTISVGTKTGQYTGQALTLWTVFPYPPGYEPHGRGVMRWSDGTSYDGQWEHGKYSGTGKYTSNDEEYIGSWSNGVKAGHAKQTWKDGSRVYDGWFVAGKKSGVGTLKYVRTGVSYSGNWSNDIPSGHGIWHWANGDWWEGTWGGPWGKDAVGKGKTLSHYDSGGTYEGETHGTKFTGRGTITTPKGGVYRGMVRDNQKHGVGTLKTVDGTFYEGTWSYGQKTGRFKVTNLSTGVMKKRNF